MTVAVDLLVLLIAEVVLRMTGVVSVTVCSGIVDGFVVVWCNVVLAVVLIEVIVLP